MSDKKSENSFRITAITALSAGVGLLVGIAAGPGILGGLVIGALGAAAGGATGLVAGTLYFDAAEEVKFIKDKVVARAKEMYATVRPSLSKAKKTLSASYNKAAEATKTQIARFRKDGPSAENAPKRGKTAYLAGKEAGGDFSKTAGKQKKTAETAVAASAPAQKKKTATPKKG